MLAAIGRRIIRAIEIVRLYRNWPYAFLCYFRLLRRPEVTYVLRNGIKFMARVDDLEAVAAISDVWLREAYAHRRGDIQTGQTVVDIGAHIGSFSVFAATRAEQIKVYSYEPSQENFHFLTENIKLNGLKNVKAFELAVSGRRGKVRLYIDEKRSTFHSTAVSKKSYVEVNSVTLQDVIGDNKIDTCDLLKLDCEGAEYEILLGASESILMKIRNIALEYHDVPIHHVDELRRRLENMGFDVWLAKIPVLYASRHV